jgi:hypothetical protein
VERSGKEGEKVREGQVKGRVVVVPLLLSHQRDAESEGRLGVAEVES